MIARRSQPVATIAHLEHSEVTLRTAVRGNDRIIPPGATGTVVGILGGGAAYAVEFTKPFHTVAIVEAEALKG